ncbi:hypothetical protein M5362_14035 [Streptomyces sp. Je 1-79]|uniref:hypothetical protein n=1 Tax=Streptomyces sp. Je 1-79 TaxID=2943847 RepID=UPI0021A5D692|nr:hypothetical protein [Streptomyces sp. Je 1-79]MCT4354250.1 hypothetical protein [Streptomyces sp. Je 1-79]
MFAYELHRMHHSELLREAAARRLVRQAVRTRRAAKADRSGGQDTEGQVGTRHRFVRAA